MTITHENLSLRAKRTRHAMIDAGLDLLVGRPIDAIPIDDIVAAARVAKGSFFNHFIDKQGFSEAIATEIRSKIEQRIGIENADVTDPIERLVGGMCVSAEFALTEHKQAIAFMRSNFAMTARNHPLNQGVRSDIEACLAIGAVRAEAADVGVLYWLGLCQIVITNIVERQFSRSETAARLRHMVTLGLTGLGVVQSHVEERAASAEKKLLSQATTSETLA